MGSGTVLVAGVIVLFTGICLSFNRIAHSSPFEYVGGENFPKNLNLFNVVRLLFANGPVSQKRLSKQLCWIGLLHWVAFLVGLIGIVFVAVLLRKLEVVQ